MSKGMRDLTPLQQDEIYNAVSFRLGKLASLITDTDSPQVYREATARLAALTEAAQELNVQRSGYYAAHPEETVTGPEEGVSVRTEEQVTIAIMALDHAIATAGNAMAAQQVASRKAALEWVMGGTDPIVSPLVGDPPR